MDKGFPTYSRPSYQRVPNNDLMPYPVEGLSEHKDTEGSHVRRFQEPYHPVNGYEIPNTVNYLISGVSLPLEDTLFDSLYLWRRDRIENSSKTRGIFGTYGVQERSNTTSRRPYFLGADLLALSYPQINRTIDGTEHNP